MSTLQQIQTYEPGKHFVLGLPFKAHKIEGFSPEMLEQHYEEIYGGAVRRLNDIERDIATGRGDTDALRTEELRIANCVTLHELYFGSIAEEGGGPLWDATLNQAIDASFGSFADWQNDFSSIASANDGWIVLSWSNRFGRLMITQMSEDTHAMVDADPILVLDMAKHAYSADFGTDRKLYIDAFIKSIHWERVAERFQRALRARESDNPVEDATQISVAILKDRLDKGEDILVLDVRHEDDRERYRSRILETEWHDSFDVATWAKDLPKDKPFIVYCMCGFWVSQKAAQELREQGIDARSLSGALHPGGRWVIHHPQMSSRAACVSPDSLHTQGALA